MAIDWYSVKAQVRNDIQFRAENNGYVQEERERGISILTAALYENGVDDDQIIRSLQKYYHVTEADAEDRLRNEKTIEFPCRKLHTYLMREQGFSHEDSNNFIFEHNIPELLKNNIGLWKQTPGEILQLAERN